MKPEERGYEGWIKPYYSHLQGLHEMATSIASGDLSPLKKLEQTWEAYKERQAADLINAIVANERYLELAVNVPNEGHIMNLPPYAVVEVPALIGGSGIHPLSMGSLP